MYLWATVHAVQICISNKYHFILIIGDYNKLKIEVAEILEEKTQVEEKKQIITG